MAKVWKDGSPGYEAYLFHCPGCGHLHAVYTKHAHHGAKLEWSFNDKQFGGNIPPERCHSFIREGKIQFLDDCTHHLKGQTVEMEDVKTGPDSGPE